MAQGTIKVTNGSVDVVGTGTAFTSMKPGSFLTFVLVGVAYTVAIDSVQSATALKLAVKFDGPTTSGVAFDESPVGSMALATMGVTVQAQKALRMMIADQTNWREVFSSKQTITVTLPDGTQFTGYSWGYISEQLKTINLPALQAVRDETIAARNKAQTYATNASNSATSAGTANTNAQAAKTGAETARNQAQTYQQQAAGSATTAGNAATTATNQAGIATTQAGLAKQYADSVNPANLLARGNNLSDVADKALSRTNLGLGSASTYNIGTSGGTIPLLNTSNSWTGTQYILTGGLQVGSQNTGNTGIELGSVTTKTPAFIDFHSSGTGSDYDARIYVAEGSSTVAKGSMTISAGTLIYGGGDLNVNDGSVRMKGGNSIIEHGGYPAFIIDNTDRAATDPFSRAMFELGPQSGAVPSLIARRRDGNQAGQIRIPFAQVSGEMVVNVAYFTSAAGQLNANSRRNTEFRTFTNATTTADGIPFSGYGVLTSFGRGPDRVAGNYTGQLCWNKGTNELYSRAGEDTSTTWRDWVKVTTSAVSDETLKDIKGDLNLEGALDNVNRMEFKLFRFKDDTPDRSTRRGVISQQIMKIDKEYVWKVGDYYHLDQTPMLLDGLAAIKALRARDESRKVEIENIASEVEELRKVAQTLIEKFGS